MVESFHPVSGGYGFVFVAQDTSTGKEYALKVTCPNSVLCGDYFYLFGKLGSHFEIKK